MSTAKHFPLIAGDVGNSGIKLGLFDGHSHDQLPQPNRILRLPGDNPDLARIAPWLQDVPEPELSWWISSVNRPVATRLIDWIRGRRQQSPITMLAVGDLSLEVALERPDMVGIDRLLNAVAANHLRSSDRSAIVVDVGSAITVDLLSAEGAFMGGAIVPGIAMSARAFHTFTDLLPLIEMSELSTPPPALGTSTVPAMRSGLFWGAVGAIRQLIRRLADEVPHDPEVFLSGGAGPTVAQLLGDNVRHVPHLTLSGIALTAAASL